MTEALHLVSEHFAHEPNFRGLVCLEQRKGVRNEIVVLTLWDGDGLEETKEQSELARQRIAATTDLSVSMQRYEVLRLVPAVAVDNNMAYAS